MKNEEWWRNWLQDKVDDEEENSMNKADRWRMIKKQTPWKKKAKEKDESIMHKKANVGWWQREWTPRLEKATSMKQNATAKGRGQGRKFGKRKQTNEECRRSERRRKKMKI